MDVEKTFMKMEKKQDKKVLLFLMRMSIINMKIIFKLEEVEYDLQYKTKRYYFIVDSKEDS